MQRRILRQIARYALAAVVIACAVGVTVLVPPFRETPTIFFFFGVLVTAWYGGRGPAMLAVVLSIAAINYFFIEPLYTFNFGVADLARAVGFVLVSAMVIWFAEMRRRTESTLREQAARLKEQAQVLNLSHVLISTIDGRITSWNEGAIRIYGWRKEEAEGRNSHELLKTEFPRALKQIQTELAKTGRWEGELARTRKNGTHVFVHTQWVLHRDHQSNELCILEINNDVTRQKQLEESFRIAEQRFSRFMRHLPGLAWIKDLDGRYVYVNAAAEKAFGKSRSELYGRTDDEIFPPETAIAFRENDRKAIAGESGIQTIEFLRHPDGDIRHSLVNKFPIVGADGAISLVGGMAIDITERIRAEEALRDAGRRKDEFLAILAHELRNPLAPIRTGIQVLRMPLIPDAEREQVHEMLERQMQHLVRLIDDLLDIARIREGKIHLRKERVSLDVVVQDAIDACRPHLQAGKQEFHWTLPDEQIWLHADGTRISQILLNLLNNAVKFTDPGGRITLNAKLEGDKLLAIRVKDNGIGIPREMLPRIFERFAQVDADDRRSRGGLGIGLNLARMLVEMHGGTIEAHSDGPGQGSEFLVRLPVAEVISKPAPAPGPMPLSATANGHAKRRILVVDDKKDIADSLGMMLSLLGHTVKTANDGPSAFDAACEFEPDVALLDIGMPGMSGLDLARKIREQPRLRQIVLVALTGWGDEADRQRSHEAGFDHHLVKPIRVAVLEELLASIKR